MTKIHKSPGILFDPVGTLKIINDEFHIVIPVDVSPLEYHMENIHDVFNIIRSQCRSNDEIDINQCQNLLQPLEALYSDISRDFNSISHIMSNSISKRAWFGGIGVAFKHIFGTLDEDDAQNYENAIQALQRNDEKLMASLKKTIMVSQSAISNINRSIHELNTNEAKLTDVIESLSLSVKNVSDAVNIISFKVKINNILNVLEANLLTMSFKIEDLLNSILFVKSNTLHPSILTPSQMYKDLVGNLKILPKYKDFPVSLDISNIHVLINTADLTCYYLNNKLMFIVKLPLVSLQQYNLYKNIPLPTPHTNDKLNSFAMIVPSEQFLALAKDKSFYTYLKDLKNCKNILTETYLCEITDVYAVLSSPSCEIEIITKALTSLPETCPYKFIIGEVDIWHRLNDNKWIFVQSKPAKLSIECDNVVSEIVISGTGVLNIPLQCVAFYKNIKFVTKNYPKLHVPNVITDFNIINDSCCNFHRLTEISPKIPISKIRSINLDSISDFKTVTDQISQDLVLEVPTLQNHMGFSIFNIVSITIVVSLVLYFCIKYKLYKCQSNKHTVTTPPEETNENTVTISAPRLRT